MHVHRTGAGSGKTLAFLLPIVMHCKALRAKEPEAPAGVKAVVVSGRVPLALRSSMGFDARARLLRNGNAPHLAQPVHSPGSLLSLPVSQPKLRCCTPLP